MLFRSLPVVMSELVTTSITSGPPPQRLREVYRRPGNDVAFYEDACRGYLWLEMTSRRLEARLQGFDSVRSPEGAVERTVFSCALEDGQRGLRT